MHSRERGLVVDVKVKEDGNGNGLHSGGWVIFARKAAELPVKVEICCTQAIKSGVAGPHADEYEHG